MTICGFCLWCAMLLLYYCRLNVSIRVQINCVVLLTSATAVVSWPWVDESEVKLDVEVHSVPSHFQSAARTAARPYDVFCTPPTPERPVADIRADPQTSKLTYCTSCHRLAGVTWLSTKNKTAPCVFTSGSHGRWPPFGRKKANKVY